MTVQALADRCAELGVPLGRVTLTKLEGGKRQAITPAELTVLAAALGVSPIELLYPIGYRDMIEILPGYALDPIAVVQWFCGELKLDLTSEGAVLRRPAGAEESSVYLVQLHRDLTNRLLEAEDDAARALADAAAPGADERVLSGATYRGAVADQIRETTKVALRPIRSEMRRRGMILPPVPASLHLDEESIT